MPSVDRSDTLWHNTPHFTDVPPSVATSRGRGLRHGIDACARYSISNSRSSTCWNHFSDQSEWTSRRHRLRRDMGLRVCLYPLFRSSLFQVCHRHPLLLSMFPPPTINTNTGLISQSILRSFSKGEAHSTGRLTLACKTFSCDSTDETSATAPHA